MGDRDHRAAWLIPLEERRRLYGGTAPADPGPLTEAERDALRDRLNAGGASARGLRPREWEAWNAMTVIRPPERIAELVQEIRADRQRRDLDQSTQHYADGILQAIAWATGVTRAAPLSGRHADGALPTVGEMEREQREALDRLQAGAFPPGRGQSFVVGVEACLMWLCASCDDPPW
ncbi:hypothetical protein [Actinomadura kijaniata]|uniref:hypothetical protein n=1 Tax=Actinomadura kijaniata TaxID=46161 RepID=UPI0012F8A9E7|nr:hypothetical protein [Actinomadura kijaniata]